MDPEEGNEELQRLMAEHFARQKRLHELAKKLQEGRPKGITFTYLEYMEMSAEEMKKFAHLEPITQEDIDNVNWEQLSEQLLST
jgi:hypothetical protein